MNIFTFLNLLFEREELELIRSKRRSEPAETMRKAFILVAYMRDYCVYDIGKAINRNLRQTRYLLDKASDLLSVNDTELTNYIKKYERTLANANRTNTDIN